MVETRPGDAARGTAEDTAGGEPGDQATAPDGSGSSDGLGDTARRLYGEGEAAARSLMRTLDALQALAGHEAALARAALPQAVLFAGIGIALGLAGWLYLMALLVAWLQLWLGWPGALAAAVLLSGLGTLLCLWRCMMLLRLSRFEATRRQLRKLRRMLRATQATAQAGDGDTGSAEAPASQPGGPA